MTAVRRVKTGEPDSRRLRERVEAEAYVASVCFKHGPPELLGVELEWTVHHADDPRRPLDTDRLAAALGPHAPPTFCPGSPHLPLPAGSPLTMEPGGQVEISALPQRSLAELITAVTADSLFLTELLGAAGLVLGRRALDPYRTPRRVLRTPRYDAMEKAFEPMGPDGITMMCNTAGLQFCVDVGERSALPARWAAVHALGPPLLAAFANSPDTASAPCWVSSRMRTVLRTDPVRTRPTAITGDPVESWANRVLDTPLLCVRREGGCWDAPRGVTFADWVDGALGERPSTDDLDYHLSTLFPPVRPHGYFEIRYLDAQADRGWLTPVCLLTALTAREETLDAVLDACASVADRWWPAAREGLADAPLAAAARAVVRIGADALADVGLSRETAAAVANDLDRLLHDLGGVMPR